MMRPRIEYDLNTKVKYLKSGQTARINNENAELALTLRGSPLFARCGHDMALFIAVTNKIISSYVVTDDLLDEAHGEAVEEAKNYPYAGVARKPEDIRVEIFGDPNPMVAKLIERDDLEGFAGGDGRLSVFYGKGVVADYKPHLRKAESIAVSTAAAVLAEAQTRDPGLIKPVEDRILTPTGSPGHEPGRTVAYRIDRMLGKPVLDEKLVGLLRINGPLAAEDVVRHLMRDSGRVRLQDDTIQGIRVALGKLVDAKTLCRDEAGRYRLPPFAPSPSQGERPSAVEGGGVRTLAADEPSTAAEGIEGAKPPIREDGPEAARPGDDRNRIGPSPAEPTRIARSALLTGDDDPDLAALVQLGDQVTRAGGPSTSGAPHRP